MENFLLNYCLDDYNYDIIIDYVFRCEKYYLLKYIPVNNRIIHSLLIYFIQKNNLYWKIDITFLEQLEFINMYDVYLYLIEEYNEYSEFFKNFNNKYNLKNITNNLYIRWFRFNLSNFIDTQQLELLEYIQNNQPDDFYKTVVKFYNNLAVQTFLENNNIKDNLKMEPSHNLSYNNIEFHYNSDGNILKFYHNNLCLQFTKESTIRFFCYIMSKYENDNNFSLEKLNDIIDIYYSEYNYESDNAILINETDYIISENISKILYHDEEYNLKDITEFRHIFNYCYQNKETDLSLDDMYIIFGDCILECFEYLNLQYVFKIAVDSDLIPLLFENSSVYSRHKLIEMLIKIDENN